MYTASPSYIFLVFTYPVFTFCFTHPYHLHNNATTPFRREWWGRRGWWQHEAQRGSPDARYVAAPAPRQRSNPCRRT